MEEPNRRILLIDDNQDIHRDFGKILTGGDADSAAEEALLDAEGALFGDEDDGNPERAKAVAASSADFELESAHQGQEGVELLRRAKEAARPFAMAFVDMRMPPGWDGVETIQHLWEVDPDLQVVVCTAFADYTWAGMVAELGRTDGLLILKKPFDAIEVCQLATALTMKWDVTLRERQRMEEVVRAEGEARAYAASLETVNKALEQAKNTAEAAARSRSEFLARMTSGILDPMATLFDAADEIRRGEPESERWMSLVEDLCRDGKQLSGSLHDVLELSEMEAGTLRIEPVACSPRELVEQVAASLRPRATEGGIDLSVECDASVPATIESDPVLVGRILRHLVANALTYAGRDTVRLEVDGASAHNGTVRFSVVDRGPGMSAEQRAHLFEPFCHASSLDDDARHGTGLGLYLSKRMAQALGGDLEVSSSESGTRFALSVDVALRAAVR